MPLASTTLLNAFSLLPVTQSPLLPVCLHPSRSEEHTSELQSRSDLVCRLLLEKKKTSTHTNLTTAIQTMPTTETFSAEYPVKIRISNEMQGVCMIEALTHIRCGKRHRDTTLHS